MVEDYLSDREQEEALRIWWRENWLWVIGGVAIGLAGLGAWQLWSRHVEVQAETAAQLYTDLSGALASPAPTAADKDKAAALLTQLDAEHAKSPYSDQAHLAMARVKVAAGEYDQAIAELKVAADRSADDALVQLAQLRMARLQVQLGRPDDALALLDVNKAGAFARTMHELRGDALLAKGDRSGARLAYQAALNEGADKESAGGTELLQLKLQDLGDVEPVISAPVTPQ